MFKQTKNIDTAFRHIRLFSILFLVACVLITVLITYKSYQLASLWEAKNHPSYYDCYPQSCYGRIS